MIDRRHAGRERIVHADRYRNVSCERHAKFIGGIGNCQILVRTEARVNFDEIVPRLVLRPDLPHAVCSATDRITVHRRPGGDQAWTEDVTIL